MKKLVTLLLAVALCLSLAVPASAAGTTVTVTCDGITVSLSNVISKETKTVREWGFDPNTYEPMVVENTYTLCQIPDKGAVVTVSVSADAKDTYVYPGEGGSHHSAEHPFTYDEHRGGQVLGEIGPGGSGSWEVNRSEGELATDFFAVGDVQRGIEIYCTFADLESVEPEAAEPDLSALSGNVKSVTDGEFTLYVDNVIATETKTVTLFDAENVGKPETRTIQVFRIGASTANVALFDPSCGGPTMGHDVYALNGGVYEGGPCGQLWGGEGGFSADYATGWQKVDPKHLGGELIAVYCPGTTVGVYLAFEDVVEAAAAKPAEPAKPANPFVDVPADAYYHDAVLWALENGVTTGVTANTFAPTASCTRGQVVTFLWRASGKPEPKTTVNPFTDVKEGSAFYKAILWAYENGITSGVTADTFNPSGTCTSGHVVTFLWRANGKPAASGDSALAAANAGRYFTDALAWADSADLIAGTGSAFVPANNSPRADIVTYLYRNAQ